MLAVEKALNAAQLSGRDSPPAASEASASCSGAHKHVRLFTRVCWVCATDCAPPTNLRFWIDSVPHTQCAPPNASLRHLVPHWQG